VTNCRHRSALHSLNSYDGDGFVATLLEVIKSNWQKASASDQLGRSRQNWRWCLQTNIGPRNLSPEVIFERAVAAACARCKRDDWANQVPVASGLTPGHSGGRRAIDLVQRRAEGHYELIELKIASDTPLYAAVEALSYSMIWLLTRREPGTTTNPMLQANRIDVRVLAPADSYQTFQLAALELAMDRDIAAIAADYGAAMSFRYDVLDSRCLPGPHLEDQTLLDLLQERTALRG
jgi:hypothetical protein